MERWSTDKQLVIGLGSGKCGSTSLARLLDLQKDSEFTHEEFGISLPYDVHPKKLEKALEIIYSREPTIIGDVAFYWRHHVPYILRRIPSAKFICMKRDRELTTQSFWSRSDGSPMGNTPKTFRGVEMNIKGAVLAGQFIPLWGKNLHPNMEQLKQGTRKSWDYYYEHADRLEREFPGNFRVFPVEALNSEETVREILDFAGIPKKNQEIIVNIRENQGRSKWLKEQAKIKEGDN